ncbi:hypothetical protein HCN44_003682 [Aphidius gifuensis]|uniref:Rho GTPase-activating protein n=1 Tax=Aphidius gifuensis TaxID=684658 RepID=A0A834XM46_APHGI|nr:hypothetical protein HCN44_003682 [Aphidius gifuensis]
MDEEIFLMEEKSILSLKSNIIDNNTNTLSNFSKARVPSYSWLPLNLRQKIDESCENIISRQGYPVVDWLRQIRLSCDSLESSKTTKINRNNNDDDDDDDLSIIESIKTSKKLNDYFENDSLMDTDNVDSITSEIIPDNLQLPIDNKINYSTSVEIYHDTDNKNNNSIKINKDIKFFKSDNDEFTCYSEINLTGSDMSLNNFSTTWSFSQSTMPMKNIVCCVDLIQDENGFYKITENENLNSNKKHQLDNDKKFFFDNFHDVEYVDDDSKALKLCQIYLEESKLSNNNIETLSNVSSDNSCGTISKIFKNVFDNNRDTEYDSFDDDTSSFVINNTENNYDDNNYIIWNPAFNDYQDNESVKEFVTSSEGLYVSCDNIDDNLNIENETISKICDSDYKSFESGSLNSQKWLLDVEDFYYDDDENEEIISEYRKRKGSVSSDILMWKKDLFNQDFNDEDDFRQWFSSHDAEGKIYFFEENSNESFWVLPTKSKDQLVPTKPSTKTNRLSSSSPKFIPPPSINTTKTKINSSNTYTNTSPSPSSSSSLQQTSNISSPILHYENLQQKKLTASTTTTITEWPQLSFDGNMKIIKEGQINRTKITENGKKLRKNWSTSHAVLTELFLLFFKDSKTFSTMIKSGQCQTAKPDISVDLNGARIELGDRASSRKNVYIISTVLGLQVLIQSDNTLQSNEWYQDIDTVIKKLPSQTKTLVDYDGIRKISNSKLDKQQSEINQDDSKKDNNKVSRSRSMKIKRLDDSIEDLPSVNEKIKIKAKLRRFFLRRPSVESLVKDGIYKNEPAFGSSLQDVCPNSSPRIPAFVKRCIEVLESNEDNMKTDGLYRASGNLSQIQKIRLQIDQDKLNVLSQEEDVHVLTGALKLFFRELKEPLIPSCFFKEALNASMLKKHTTKVQCFRDIIKLFPSPNYDTLQYLLKHLLKVTTYQEFNRMHIPNLAIVFGPTLMWPAEESPNMALDLMQQNLVIECLLSEYNKIFK